MLEDLDLSAIAGERVRQGLALLLNLVEELQRENRAQCTFHAEGSAVFEAGLASSPWQLLDDTNTSFSLL